MKSMLTRLEELIKEAQTVRPEICSCEEMDKVLRIIEKRAKAGSPSDEPKDLQIEAVVKFWHTGEFESLQQARRVSFGLAVHPWNDERCLMEDRDRFDLVLDRLREWETTPCLFRRCYQGLVRSYFDYDGLGRDTPETGLRNWSRLRSYLLEKVTLIKDATINPDWVACVLENRGLFSESPCAAYAQDLLEGRDEQVRNMQQLLGITDASWFTRELIFSLIDHACSQDHALFMSMVDGLLKLIKENEMLRDRGLRRILNRYAEISNNPPQHDNLKRLSVDTWGSPLLPSNEYRWIGVTKKACQMVKDWLKLVFIEIFFHKLAQDDIGDKRRLNFWMQYINLIDNIHFALGSHAMHSQDKDFVELRKKLKGHIVELRDVNPRNNAFIMSMGDLVAVEFSGQSNAFYGYNRHSLPFDLSMPVYTMVDWKNSLKNSSHSLRLIHSDSGSNKWESRFMHELRKNFGLILNDEKKQPAAKSFMPMVYSEENLKRLVKRFGGKIVDNRKKGGVLLVIMGDLPEASSVLKSWGFSYRPETGWWKEKDR